MALDRALGRGSETRSACTGCDAEGVSCDTDEMSTEYAGCEHGVKLKHLDSSIWTDQVVSSPAIT
jgi:hypothetical protein